MIFFKMSAKKGLPLAASADEVDEVQLIMCIYVIWEYSEKLTELYKDLVK